MLLVLDHIWIRDPVFADGFVANIELALIPGTPYPARACLAALCDELSRVEPFVDAGLVGLDASPHPSLEDPELAGLLAEEVDRARPNPGVLPEAEGFQLHTAAWNEMHWAIARAVENDLDVIAPSLRESPFLDRRFATAERAFAASLPTIELVTTADFIAMHRHAEGLSAVRMAFRRALDNGASARPMVLLRDLDDELRQASAALTSDFRPLSLDLRLAPVVGAAVATSEYLASGSLGAPSAVGAVAGALPSFAEWVRRRRSVRHGDSAVTQRVILALRLPIATY